MNRSTVFMFSGQGSQYYNMGKQLYLLNPTFRSYMGKLDEAFQSITGESVIQHLYDDRRQKSEIFDFLRYTHPAIFMVEYSLAQVLMERGIYPDYVLGSSMGEFASSAISGVMSLENIIQCIAKQAQMLETQCEKGGMLAIINDYGLYEEVPVLYENSELASVNYHTHFVVSGSIDGLAEIERYLKAKEVMFLRLPVSFAFHSSLIDPAASKYTEFLNTKVYKHPQTRFISCVTGGLAASFEKDYFWDIIRIPINFPGAMKCLSEENEYMCIDLGPSGTLANFAKYNITGKSRISIFSIITPFHNDIKNLERLCESFKNTLN